MYSTTSPKSGESFYDSKDGTGIIQKLISYEVPETLKCKFVKDACKVQDFMNAICSSLSRTKMDSKKSRKKTLPLYVLHHHPA